MKKSVITNFILLIVAFYMVGTLSTFGTITATACNLDISLLSEAP